MEKLSREDWMVLGGGILLFIGLLAFPWYSAGGFDFAATSDPYSIWGIFALIVTIVVVLDLALARFSPQTVIPTSQLGRDGTRVAAVAAAVVFLVIKFLDNVGNFGWGFYIDVVLVVLVAAGAVLTAQGKATPITMAAGGGR